MVRALPPDVEPLLSGYKEISAYLMQRHGVNLAPKRLCEYAAFPSMRLPVMKPNARLVLARAADLDKWVAWWLGGMNGKPPIY